jgi:hypothetical protein
MTDGRENFAIYNRRKHKIALENYNSNPRYCIECGILLSYKQRYNKFCSSSCAAKRNNIGICRNPKKHIRICPVCNQKMSAGSLLCKKCRNNIFKRMYTSLNDKYIKSSTLRHYYEKIRGHKCEKCNLTSWNDLSITLHAHHIDGNIFNNDPSNIMILCPNCHSQTPNYCAKNRGNGKFKVSKTLK